MTFETLEEIGTSIDEAFFLIGGAILLIEIAKGLATRRLAGRGFLDMLANISTQIPFLLVEIVLLVTAYTAYEVVSQTYVSWVVPITVPVILLGVLACDLTYYWEHRIAHEVRLLWTQHAVHHSSRHMNITTGVRFGPAEGVWSAICHFPLILAGFPPEIVFFGLLADQAYQTWIHTELIGQLGPIEGILNTPANHRVHHGCDPKYIDKNYGGILMIWDRAFGTYQCEEETPRYGLVRDFDSVNPLQVWFSELPGLFRDLRKSQSIGDVWTCLMAAPGTYVSASSAPTTNQGRNSKAASDS
ncbi:MAG: sterol desaturase family protein [Candidatus Phaeomarinobacter sp.]